MPSHTRTFLAGLAFAALAAAPGLPVAEAAVVLDLSYVNTASPQYQRFANWVDDALTPPRPYGFTATDAAYRFRIAGGAVYCQLAVTLAEQQVQAAEAAIAGGARPPVAGDSYLYSGEMIRDLALAYDWCAPWTTPQQRARWEAYGEQTAWNIWNPQQATWGGQPFPWSGWSINDPGNNYHYSFLTATMYWALARNSTTWLTFLSTQKLPALVAHFQQLPGGGSREGTGYGVSHMNLFEIYRLWRDSTGQDLAAQSPHAADSIDYWLHATMPSLDRYAPIGDLARQSYPELYDYHRRLVLEARALATEPTLRNRASRWLNHISVDPMISGFNLRHDLLPAGTSEEPPPTRLHHAAGTGHLFFRSSWQPDALWLGIIAGPYDQSHAHQEQGTFTLFQGDFLAVTENIFTHSGIQQGTPVHNVIRFMDGAATVPQYEGSVSSLSVSAAGPYLHAQADLSPAYGPSGGRVTSWQRRLDFDRLGLWVRDTFTTAGGVTAIFQVNTPVQPVISGRTATAGGLRVRVEEPPNATLSIMDWRTVDPSEFLGGWKLEVRGGTNATGYRVRLELVDGIFTDGFETP